MRKKLALITLFLALASLLHAGDVAVFRNLGFSPDGRNFMFGQYGIDHSSRNPYAEVFAVDVVRNSFVSGGVLRRTFPVGSAIGEDGQKALFALMEESAATRRRLNLSYLETGRPIYFRIITEERPADARQVQVIDFRTGRRYQARLQETVTGTGAEARSSFHIDLEIRDSSGTLLTSRRAGNPQIVRNGILGYTIVQMILAPGDSHLVFVVERREALAGGGVNVRFMVETLALN